MHPRIRVGVVGLLTHIESFWDTTSAQIVFRKIDTKINGIQMGRKV